MKMAVSATESKTAPKTFGWLGVFRMSRADSEGRRRRRRRRRSRKTTKEEDE